MNMIGTRISEMSLYGCECYVWSFFVRRRYKSLRDIINVVYI